MLYMQSLWIKNGHKLAWRYIAWLNLWFKDGSQHKQLLLALSRKKVTIFYRNLPLGASASFVVWHGYSGWKHSGQGPTWSFHLTWSSFWLGISSPNMVDFDVNELSVHMSLAGDTAVCLLRLSVHRIIYVNHARKKNTCKMFALQTYTCI